MKQDPTLYEPKSMFCNFEFGSIIGGIIGGIGSLIGGSQAAGAAEDASDAQVRAAEVAAGVSREALGFQKEMYNVGRADLAPYRATGAGALQTMNNMFLPGGNSMVQMQGRLNELRAQRARLMSAGPPAAVSTPINALAPAIAQRDVGGGAGDAGGYAGGPSNVDRDFNEEFGRDFGGGDSGSGGADSSGSTGTGGGEHSDEGGRGGPDGAGYHKGGPVTDRNPGTYRNNMRINAQEGEVVVSRGAVRILGSDLLARANRAARNRRGP